MELSTALMDNSEGMESDEEAPPVDSLLFEQAYQVCSNSIQKGGTIDQKLNPSLLRFLKDNHLVDVSKSDDGEEIIVLARDAVKHGIHATNAKLERSVRSTPQESTLEVQSDLTSAGWKFTNSLKLASSNNRIAMEGNPGTYYTLLRHFYDIVVDYEEDGQFHHKQTEQYYKTIERAFTLRVGEVFEVPPYKKAEFYTQLRVFLEDDTTTDPRKDLEHPPKRTAKPLVFVL